MIVRSESGLTSQENGPDTETMYFGFARSTSAIISRCIVRANA